MEFLKTNYLKIFLISITLAGVAMFVTLLANYDSSFYGVNRDVALGVEAGPDRYNAMGFLFMYIAALTFFTMTTAIIAISMFNQTKRHNKWVIFAAGILGLVFMLCSALLPLRSDSYTLMREIRAGDRDAHIQRYVQSEVVTGAFSVDADSINLIFIFASAPMAEWHDAAEALYELSDDMSAERLADLITALDEIKNIVVRESDTAIREAKDRAAYGYLQNTITRVALLLIFASVPLVYGLKLILVKRNKGEESGTEI